MGCGENKSTNLLTLPVALASIVAVSDYDESKKARDQAYLDAWASAPEEFRRQAEEMGIQPELDGDSHAIEHKSEFASAAETIDFASVIDTLLDEMVERFGHRDVVRGVVESVTAIMERKAKQEYSLKLTRIIMLLVGAEGKNVRARVHHILHAIPGLAATTGFPTMRSSARACGCSPTWMCNGRNEVCEALGIPIPEDGTKSEEAKRKYKKAATEKHWRDQKFVAPKTTESPQHTTPHVHTDSSPQTPASNLVPAGSGAIPN